MKKKEKKKQEKKRKEEKKIKKMKKCDLGQNLGQMFSSTKNKTI